MRWSKFNKIGSEVWEYFCEGLKVRSFIPLWRGDYDPHKYRIITTFEPLSEIAVSSSREKILHMYQVLDEKIVKLKKQNLTSADIQSRFPLILKDLQVNEDFSKMTNNW